MQRLGYKLSALAIDLNSSKATAGKELSLSNWCIASLYVYHFSAVVDLVLLDTGTPGISRGIYSEDVDDGTRPRNPSVVNRVL